MGTYHPMYITSQNLPRCQGWDAEKLTTARFRLWVIDVVVPESLWSECGEGAHGGDPRDRHVSSE